MSLPSKLYAWTDTNATPNTYYTDGTNITVNMPLYNNQGESAGKSINYVESSTKFNINFTLTVNTTPSDATVTFDTGTTSGKTCTVLNGTSVTYTVARTGYVSQSVTTTVNQASQIEAKTLTKQNYTLTVNTTPADATVTFNTGTVSGHSVTVPYNTTVKYTISKTNYITSEEYSKTVTQNETVNAPALTPKTTYYAYKRDPSSISWSYSNNTQLDSITGWTAGTYGDGKYILLGSSNDDFHCYVTTSTDGVNWTTPAQLSGWDVMRPVSTVAWNGSKFIAASTHLDGSVKYYVSTSTNGTTWTTPTLISSGLVATQIIWDGTRFISKTSGAICTSTDGLSWTKTNVNITEPSSQQGGSITEIAYNGSKYVAINARGYVSTSTDAINWTTPTQKLTDTGRYDWNCIFSAHGMFFALSGSLYDATEMFAMSSDGENWTIQQGVLPKVRTIHSAVGINSNAIKVGIWNAYPTTGNHNYIFTGLICKYDEIYVKSLDGSTVLNTAYYLKNGNTFTQATLDSSSKITNQQSEYILVQDGSKYLRDSSHDEIAQ